MALTASETGYSGPKTGPITRLSGGSPEQAVSLVHSLMFAGGMIDPAKNEK